MQELDWIFKRRSIRKFTQEPLDEEQVNLLLQAAMAAPSAMNLKPWKFIVVQAQDQLAALKKALPFGKVDAPCAIVVCGDLKSFRKVLVERYWQQDCSAAAENILLAATAMGLGSVWCGVHPIATTERAVQAALEIPNGVIPLNAIFVGYPAEEKEARTQFSEKNVYYDKYGAHRES